MRKLLVLLLLFPSIALAQPIPGNTSSVTVSSSALPSGAATAAKQDTGNTSLASIDGKITACNTGAVTVSSSALPTGAATAAKQPALGTAGTASSDVLTVQGIASMTALKVDGSAVTQPISASSLPLPTGAATETTLGTRLSESDFDTKVGSLTESAPASDTASSGLNGRLQRVAQRITSLIALVPSALTGSGNFKVSLQESNATQAATQSGTWTVQPGNTANTTPWLVTLSPATSGGFTTYHLVSAASTNATVVKASAGQLYGWYIYNSNASARKVAFHNSASSPTAGASIFFTIFLPGGSAANVFNDTGIPFSSGIAITTVTDLADSGTTAVGANDLNINLFYK